MNIYEAYDKLSKINLKEEKQYRSEYKRLMSTPEGREKYKNLSPDERYDLIQADMAIDPVNAKLREYSESDFEFDYEGGFEREWHQDHFDPYTTQHYTTGGVDYWDDFTYQVDPVSVFEVIRDDFPNYVDKVPANDIITKCKALYTAWQNSTDDTEEETSDAYELFIAEHLEELAEIFYDQLHDYFADNAEEYAINNLDPHDPKDDYEFERDDYDFD